MAYVLEEGDGKLNDGLLDLVCCSSRWPRAGAALHRVRILCQCSSIPLLRLLSVCTQQQCLFIYKGFIRCILGQMCIVFHSLSFFVCYVTVGWIFGWGLVHSCKRPIKFLKNCTSNMKHKKLFIFLVNHVWCKALRVPQTLSCLIFSGLWCSDQYGRTRLSSFTLHLFSTLQSHRLGKQSMSQSIWHCTDSIWIQVDLAFS